VDGRVFRELLSVGYGLLPGRLPGSSWYLDHEVGMAVRGTSNFINDQRSGAKLWICRKHCASLVYWLRQELKVRNSM
jgi:hypothetical protein